MNQTQLEELLLQALETEAGGIQVYTNALKCAVNEDLRADWHEYLEQTTDHEKILRRVIEQLGFDPAKQTPGRSVVHHIGASLVKAIQLAKASAPPKAAEIVACECVVLAETKDHANWELLQQCADAANGKEAQILKAACDEVEDEEDEHLYHSEGWCRELAIKQLGMPSVIPPPEEQKDVKTAVGAARVKQTREQML
jgi:rubrerythrin